jgi:hypothetical protein
MCIYSNKSAMRRKRMLSKKTVIVASSVGAIPLTALLIAIVGRRAKNRSLQKRPLIKQTRSESNTLTNIGPSTHSQQQKEESQSQSESLLPELEIVEATTTTTITTTTTTTTTTSTNTTNTDKDIAIPVGFAVVVPSPIEPSSTAESLMKASPSHSSKEQEIPVSDEARKAGESLKELIVAAIKDAKNSAKGTGKRLRDETIGIAATTDSKDIQSIGDTLNTLVGLFEKTMTEIRKEDYNAQIKLLQSYKDLLQAQIKVANARGIMARKLKPGA